ncbi:MAG: 2-oxo-4-hydroxy-4-carboxy-5-ureidoimidazoline decarboxylase [Tardiphaga sp.]
MISRTRWRMLCLSGALLLSALMPLQAGAAEPDMAGINAMDRTAFVAQFGGIFENSPWVAEQAWERRPFATLDAMHGAMVGVARTAPAPVQIALLQSHPDLAGKEAQAGAMTASSVAEQASAGLSALQPAEMSEIAELNAAYKKKFGFPFIIAVRMYTKEGIFFEFRRRLHNDTATEFGNDLQNVYVITRLRLNKMLNAG